MAGDHTASALAAVYQEIYDLASTRRRAVDRTFAHALAGWTREGPDDLLTVETVLSSVVAPLVRAGSDDARPVLFIVVDGMTAAIAAQLATEVTAHGWVEV